MEGKNEILNEMILLEKEAWEKLDNIPSLKNFDEIDQLLENVSLFILITDQTFFKMLSFNFQSLEEVTKISEEDYRLKDLEEFRNRQLAKDRKEIFELQEEVKKGMNQIFSFDTVCVTQMTLQHPNNSISICLHWLG